MPKHQSYLQVLHLVLLITIFQILTVRSFPFKQPQHEPRDPADGYLGPGLAIPYVSSSSVYEYIVTQKHVKHTSRGCHQPVYVVGNGQVKAACTTSTKVISVTTAGSTIVSSSIITSWYTPVPRQDTTLWSSTSTTTVFVVPTPAGPQSTVGSATSTPRLPPSSASEQPAQTTTLPDSSLTSLTTSEVQTLTEEPITNTSGVSRDLQPVAFSLSRPLWR